MNEYCIFALAFLYLEIFSGQTTGRKVFLYDCGSSNSFCLNISDVREDWETANSNCVQQEGRLFDPSENLLRYHGIPLNTGGEYYWTGIHRVPNTDYFQMTDGENLSDRYYYYYYPWEDNHPIDGIDCVGYDGETNKLLSLECNTTHLAVCRNDGDICRTLAAEYKGLCSYLTIRPDTLTENTLRDMSSNFNVTTGDYIQFYNNSYEFIVAQVSANTTTEISGYRYSMQISADPSEARKTVVWRIPSDYRGDYDTSTFIVRSGVITVYTNSNSSGADLTIDFETYFYYYYTYEYQCAHLTSDGHWSTEGVDTEFFRSNGTVQCTTRIQNIRTIALGVFIITQEVRVGLISLTVIMSLISLLFLVSSLVIFIASGRKFFSHDINILHFNNTLSLLIALISVAFFPLPIYYSVFEPICIPVKFFLHFLWTNVFLSSLSIAISVFYTIWIVSINCTAKKLSIFLIPIGWAVSLVWAAAWTTYRSITGDFSMLYCFFSDKTNFEFPWVILAPMIAILLINTALLIASLFKVWLVLRKQSSQQGELKRLRKVVISGILLIPALGLPFITLLVIQMYEAPEGINKLELNILAFICIMLINSPIGIIHFILITCQLGETIIRKYCCCCRKVTAAQIAHSLHFNIVRPKPKQKNHETVYEHSTVQQTPDTIPDSVPSNDSAVFSDDSTQAVI